MLDIIFAIILISMLFVMIRAISGPTIYDRILAANVFGTKAVILIVLMCTLVDDTMFLDVALIYAMINFVTTIGLLKYFKCKSLGKS